MFSLHTGINSSCRSEYLDAFAVESHEEMEQLKLIVASGLELFYQIMGYQSRTCISPCYTWSSEVERILSKEGVRALQGMLIQRVRIYGSDGLHKKKYHYTGQRNQLAQHILLGTAFLNHLKPTGLILCLIVLLGFRQHLPGINQL